METGHPRKKSSKGGNNAGNASKRKMKSKESENAKKKNKNKLNGLIKQRRLLKEEKSQQPIRVTTLTPSSIRLFTKGSKPSEYTGKKELYISDCGLQTIDPECLNSFRNLNRL
jgi:hypothetical protein